MAHQNHELETKLAQVRQQRETLERQVEALQNNANVQERVVRQILGFVKRNEMVIEFE